MLPLLAHALLASLDEMKMPSWVNESVICAKGLCEEADGPGMLTLYFSSWWSTIRCTPEEVRLSEAPGGEEGGANAVP